MSSIELIEIIKTNNSIEYSYSISSDLQRFFTEERFIINYSDNIEIVPDSISAIPFVCNVLPIIWLTDSKLVVPELDEAFYECLPKVKQGYENMYPETSFRGEIEVGQVIPNNQNIISKRCAMFFSGGVDSVETLYRHLDEKPLLVCIWGSDIRYDNERGWSLLQKTLEEAAEQFHLDFSVIRTRFRDFDSEKALSDEYGEQLQRNYWYGIKHAMGLLGHVAVLAYLHNLSVFYISSSNCLADGEIRCASDPRTDNYIRFSSCQVVHDGFEFSRQDKLKNIVCFNEKRQMVFPLHVCWETQTGENCCTCEKCYRTMTGLIMENADLRQYGFLNCEKELPYMRARIAYSGNHPPKTWNRIHEDIVTRQKQLQSSPFWKDIKWLVKADFITPNALKVPLMWRIRTKLSKIGVFRSLWKIKRMIMK